MINSLQELLACLKKECDREKRKREVLAISHEVRKNMEASGNIIHSSDHADIYDEYGLPI